ncbi:nuclear transport factor 2 [Malania oleifera]|uniref:nuclear transport factor 2 n=1 Tax=Malania oleifera TaxID=397392 RepID=UPI0025ADA999|nr:nuclear transport factor 2 [Malania oleifera]XP_057952874.1 nuclear transport factor 2 [Malania oleifera]
MAMQETGPAAPSAQVVGNAFVEQYYHILHQSPGLVYRFYQDSSMLSRPDSNGVMTTVSTMQEINDKILSLNYEDYKAEIETADAQESYNGGVIVLVTGCLTGKDNVRRKFTQTFFLAPQDKGYFVLNDVSRFMGENVSLQNNSISVNDASGNASPTNSATDSEPTHVSDHPVLEPAISLEVEDLNNGDQVRDPSDNGEGSVIEEEVVVEFSIQSDQNEMHSVVDSTPATQEDTPKKSYASIVKVMKGNSTPSSVYVPTGTVRAAPANTDQQSLGSAKSASVPEASVPTSDSAPESSDVNVEAEGHSIYVRNLPLNATVTQLDEVFNKFGPIKHGGIQVRSSKGFCFGFVEFELLSSMESALKASPITIGDREAEVEIKRTTTRVGSGGRGRFGSGRGGFRNDSFSRNDSFRGRGNFGGGRGYGNYGRSDFRNQGEFPGRRRGPPVRNGEGYQWVNQDGSGRGGRRVG